MSKQVRVNDKITAKKVLLINDQNVSLGLVPIEDALKAASSVSMDLVEVNPNGDAPVCKIMNYGRLKFKLNKAEKKNNSKRRQLKEIKLRPVTDDGDYKVKIKKVTDFLEDGHKVKVTIFYRRTREMSHQDLSQDLLKRILQDLSEVGGLDYEPKSEGRQIHMVFSPKKK